MMQPSDIAKMCEMQTNALLYNLRPDVIEKRKRDSEFVQNCPMVEWERDMGFSVPVCSLDGQYCNRQCRAVLPSYPPYFTSCPYCGETKEGR